MKSTISKQRLTSLLVVFAFVAGMAATASATIHPLSGNGRFQIGDGLPIPITFAGVPQGRLLPVTNATVSQTGADPMVIKFKGDEMKAAVIPAVVPVFNTNKAVFQVKTALGITYPTGANTLSAGKRTGASVVSWCPADGTITANENPGCATAATSGDVTGVMVYTATGNQFGGPMKGNIFGGADVALFFGTAAPCTGCKAIMALASPNPNPTAEGAVGFPFGGTGTSPGAAPSSGRLTVDVTSNGLITNAKTTLNFSKGLPNPATSYGAPWTTGTIEISANLALGSAEMFTLMGSDNRVSGVGNISLVAGGLSNRGISGPNANRGWLNLTIGAPLGALPSMSGPGIAALVGLMSLAGGYAMRQRRK